MDHRDPRIRGVLSTRSWLATEDTAGIASGDDTEDMVAAVERAARVADLVIVTVHWGRELDTQPRPDDIARAEAMVAAGADIIFGHHQHRLSPMGWVDGRPVAWGLGNFIWPRISVPSATTAIARVIVHPDGRMGACLIPAEIVRSGHPVFTGERPGIAYRCTTANHGLEQTPRMSTDAWLTIDALSLVRTELRSLGIPSGRNRWPHT